MNQPIHSARLDPILEKLVGHEIAEVPLAETEVTDPDLERGMHLLLGDLFPGATYLVVGGNHIAELLNLAWYQAIYRKLSVAFLCLESQPTDIVRSLLALTSDVPLASIPQVQGSLAHSLALSKAAAKLKATRLAFYQSPSTGIFSFLKLLKGLSKDEDTEVLFIDCIDRIRIESDQPLTSEELVLTSGLLHSAARKSGITIFAGTPRLGQSCYHLIASSVLYCD
jgi:replicative DNA helicase